MTEKEETLKAKEQEFILLLLQKKSLLECARILNTTDRTLRRWLTYPHVQKTLTEARQNINSTVYKQIEDLSTKAITALDECLTNTYVPSVRLKAAQIVLDRVAPETKQSEQAQPPAQNEILPRDLLQYASNEEIDQMNSFIDTLQTRKRKADQDRARLHA